VRIASTSNAYRLPPSPDSFTGSMEILDNL